MEAVSLEIKEKADRIIDLNGKPKIAYFSMEIGLDKHIPTYSGGLGILAGDTLKSCADLNIPIVVGQGQVQGMIKSSAGSPLQDVLVTGEALLIPCRLDRGLEMDRIPSGRFVVRLGRQERSREGTQEQG